MRKVLYNYIRFILVPVHTFLFPQIPLQDESIHVLVHQRSWHLAHNDDITIWIKVHKCKSSYLEDKKQGNYINNNNNKRCLGTTAGCKKVILSGTIFNCGLTHI